jgi:hypothetical protein
MSHQHCGHKFGEDPQYEIDAKRVGELMAKHGIKFIFGGGETGLMGASARAALDNGGAVVGVSTHDVIALQEPILDGITESIITDGIMERKQKMYDLSDAFFILPGGFGTLNEVTDIVTMQQINETKKKIYFLNTNGFWDMFGRVFAHMYKAGFISEHAEYEIRKFAYPDDMVAAYLKDFGMECKVE